MIDKPKQLSDNHIIVSFGSHDARVWFSGNCQEFGNVQPSTSQQKEHLFVHEFYDTREVVDWINSYND